MGCEGLEAKKRERTQSECEEGMRDECECSGRRTERDEHRPVQDAIMVAASVCVCTDRQIKIKKTLKMACAPWVKKKQKRLRRKGETGRRGNESRHVVPA